MKRRRVKQVRSSTVRRTGRPRKQERLPVSGDLSGRVALVTGGGSGIGRAISLALGRAGARVMVNYLSKKGPAEKVTREIRGSGSDAKVIRADVSTAVGAEKAVEAAVRAFGGLDILVNNVGDFLHKPLLSTRPEEWDSIIESNLYSAFYCSNHAVSRMRKRKWGRIVNLGVAGCENLRAFPNTTAYNISKAGVLILTKSLAKETAPFGITVNLVAPGLIDTGAAAGRTVRQLMKALPMQRTGTPEEIAGIVLFLMSDHASYITGSCITASGGWLL